MGRAKTRLPWPGRWRCRTVVSDSDELLTLLGLSADDLAIDRGQTFPLRVPRAFVARMQPGRGG
jgi:L-lysine 2,3-aminomutase